MDDQEEIIRVGTINGWVFKIAIWFAPLFAVWMTTKVLAHDTEIAVLKMRMNMHDGGKVSLSVNVGQTKEGKESQMTAKTWLTTKDVAEREGITERTVINYIENGMIEPTPRKNGKAWEIAEHFRIIPNDSESCGEMPQGP
jgi:hypothetical protein